MLRVIKDEVCVNRRRLRWITQFEALIIFTIIYAKTESNNCFIMYSISRKKKSLPARWLFAFPDTPQKYFETVLLLSSYFYDLLEKEQRRNFFLRLTVQTMQLKAILFTLQKDLVLVGAIILRLFLNGLERIAFQSKVVLHADTLAAEITRHKRE